MLRLRRWALNILRRWRGADGYVYVEGQDVKFFYGAESPQEMLDYLEEHIGSGKTTLMSFKWKPNTKE